MVTINHIGMFSGLSQIPYMDFYGWYRGHSHSPPYMVNVVLKFWLMTVDRGFTIPPPLLHKWCTTNDLSPGISHLWGAPAGIACLALNGISTAILLAHLYQFRPERIVTWLVSWHQLRTGPNWVTGSDRMSETVNSTKFGGFSVVMGVPPSFVFFIQQLWVLFYSTVMVVITVRGGSHSDL